MDSSRLKNLKLLWWLRCLAIAGQAVTIMVAIHGFGIALAVGPLWAIIGTQALVNLLTFWRIKHARGIAPEEFFLQIFADMAALFCLLYFTGGVANPFASLFILQVIIAATVLPAGGAWLAAACAIGLYTLLFYWHVDVPYFMHHDMDNFFSLHVQGMWACFVLLALIVPWFIVRMNRILQRQAALLADAEKLAAIGALAAGAAHELGTPLSTLAILAEDAGPRSALFREQLARCKEILSRITAMGGVARVEGGAPQMLDAFLREIAARWQEGRPQVVLTLDIQAGASPRIVGDAGVGQAIRALLDNAADASPHAVRLQASWNAQSIAIAVEDKGSGMAPEISANLGQPGVTNKMHGMGMGIFLARSVVARLDGTLDFLGLEDGGMRARIALPMRGLKL